MTTYNKVWFHIASNCGGCTGIGDMWYELSVAKIPFGVYAANDHMKIVEASIYPEATLIFRDVEASTVNPAHYNSSPKDAAVVYWKNTVSRLPAAIAELRNRVWIELLNEPGREPYQAAWVGEIMYEMALLAIADGYRVCGPGWAPGNPEPEAWLADGWKDYLRLCSQQPNRVAVSLHEYSLNDNIHFGEPWHIGRFRFLFDACKEIGVAKPNVFITECGWTLNSMPKYDKASEDIAYLAKLYAGEPTIKAAFLWTLQNGDGNGDLPQKLNALMPWLTGYAKAARFPDPAPQPNPGPTPPPVPDPTPPPAPAPSGFNFVANGGFGGGHYDYVNDKGERLPIQIPVGWGSKSDPGLEFVTYKKSDPSTHNPFDSAEHSRFGQPECNVLHKSKIPEREWASYIKDDDGYTYKWFGKAHRGRLKQTIKDLPAGRYEFRAPFFVDAVAGYTPKPYPKKIWATSGTDCFVKLRANEKDIKLDIEPYKGQTYDGFVSLEPGTSTEVYGSFDHPGGDCKVAIHLMMPYALPSNCVFIDRITLMAAVPAPPPPPPPPAPKPGEPIANVMWSLRDQARQWPFHGYPLHALEDQIAEDGWQRGGPEMGIGIDGVWHAYQLGILPSGKERMYYAVGPKWEVRYVDGPATTPPKPTPELPFDFYAWPTTSRIMTQAFGANPDRYAQYNLPGHEGVDLRAAHGTAVFAVDDGEVYLVTDDVGNYGIQIRIAHKDGWKTVYAHLEKALVKIGDKVTAGQQIATADNTGKNSNGSHLHLTLKRDGHTQGNWPSNIHDPTPFLKKFDYTGPVVTPPVVKIDLLEYMNGDGRLYEVRHPKTGNQERFQVQRDGTKFYLVKNGQWEELWADNEFIWRRTDTSPGPHPDDKANPRNRFYIQYEDGKSGARWAPRFFPKQPGYTWSGSGHNVKFYFKDNCEFDPRNSGRATNKFTFVAHHATKTWNGVTVKDVIEIVDTGGERSYFAKGLGLVAWSSKDGGDSAIAELHALGARPDNVRETLRCKEAYSL